MADPIRYTPVVQPYSWAEGDPDDYHAVMRIDPSGAFVRFEVDPWVPIEECGELERGRYLVQLRSGAQIVALWSGDSEGWVLRQRDLDEFDSPRDITHVHQMGPIRGPEENSNA